MKKSPLFIIFLIAFVDLAGFGLILPLQGVYAERMHASTFTFGLLVGAYAATQFIFNPILGRWSDRVGRKRVLLLCIGGSVVSHILLGVADIAQSLPLLFVARILDGLSGANIATAQAYIADVTTEENRAKGMGMFGAAFGLGFVVGPAMGAGLAWLGTIVSGEQFGTSWPAFGASALSLVATILVWRLLPESRPDRERTSDSGKRRGEGFRLMAIYRAMKDPRLAELLTMTFATTFAFVLLEVTLVFLCIDTFALDMTGIGLVFTYLGIVMVIVQGGLVGRLARRFGEPAVLSVAPFVTAIGFVLITGALFTQTTSLAWCMLLVGLLPTVVGHGLTGPNINALISRQAHKDRQGVTLGFSHGVASLARALGPPLGGLLYWKVGPHWPYWGGAAILVMAGVFATSIRVAQRASLERES